MAGGERERAEEKRNDACEPSELQAPRLWVEVQLIIS